MKEVMHLETTHEMSVTFDGNLLAGHPAKLTVRRCGLEGEFSRVSLEWAGDQRSIWECPVAVLKEVLRLYENLPVVPSSKGAAR